MTSLWRDLSQWHRDGGGDSRVEIFDRDVIDTERRNGKQMVMETQVQRLLSREAPYTMLVAKRQTNDGGDSGDGEQAQHLRCRSSQGMRNGGGDSSLRSALFGATADGWWWRFRLAGKVARRWRLRDAARALCRKG
jgi:hypothetical protein